MLTDDIFIDILAIELLVEWLMVQLFFICLSELEEFALVYPHICASSLSCRGTLGTHQRLRTSAGTFVCQGIAFLVPVSWQGPPSSWRQVCSWSTSKSPRIWHSMKTKSVPRSRDPNYKGTASHKATSNLSSSLLYVDWRRSYQSRVSCQGWLICYWLLVWLAPRVETAVSLTSPGSSGSCFRSSSWPRQWWRWRCWSVTDWFGRCRPSRTLLPRLLSNIGSLLRT